MYNIWCELEKTHILFGVAVGAVFAGDYFIYNTISFSFGNILLVVLLLYLIFSSIIKYNTLKKYGKNVYSVPYRIVDNKGEKQFIVDYTNEQGVTKQLYKKNSFNKYRKDYEKLPVTGFTNILINPKNEKQYYIFFPY